MEQVLGLGGAGGDEPRVAVDVRPLHALGNGELLLRRGAEGHPHEVHPDGQRRLGAVRAPEDGLLLVEAHPHPGADARGEAQEPGVRVLLGGAGLAGHGPVELVGPGPGAALGDALQALDQLVVGHGIDHGLAWMALVGLQHPAVAVHHLLDEEEGGRLEPAVGDGGVAPHHVLERQVRAAQGHARHPGNRFLDPGRVGELDHVLDAGRFQDAHGRDVPGVPQRLPDGDGPPEVMLVVLGLVDGAVEGVPDGAVVHQGRGILPLGEGGSVDEGLHGGAHLPLGLYRAVELAPLEAEAAHHGADLPRGRIHRQERALHGRILVQLHLGGRAVGVRFLHLEERSGAAREQLPDILPRPGEGAPRHIQDLLGEANPGPVAFPAQDHALHGVAWLQEPLPARQLGLVGILDELHGLLAEAPAAVGRLDPCPDGLVRGLLPGGVQGRVDLEPLGQHGVLAVLLVQVLPDLLHRIGRDVLLLGVAPGQADGLGLQHLGLGGVEVALGDHAVQHVVATDQGRGPGLGIGVVGVVVGGPLDQPGQQGAFLLVELGRALAEVVLGRGLDAVAAAAEVHLVGVHLQDLLLGVGLLQLAGQDDLLELAVQALLPLVGHGPDELHGQRGGPFPPLPEAGHEVPGGPHQAAARDAAVVHEVRVLRGHQRVHEGLGDVAEGDHLAVLLGEDADGVPVAVHHLRDGLDRPQGEVGQEVVRVAAENRPHHGQGHGAHGGEAQQPPAQQAEQLPRGGSGFSHLGRFPGHPPRLP